MELKRKFYMEDSAPRLIQSLLTGCSNQRQVRTPLRPIISQGITFKELLHGRHRSSAELRPSSTPSPPWAPNSFHTKAYATTRIRSRGGKTYLIIRCFFKLLFILSVHVSLRGPSAKEIFH
ncbi:hypothetical protein CRENBAI_007584 [Crenichthys baileyi]|uniref:Uncharacterized protein n=1 Tax=Crenichthys baileyi TaxID=28760 RepID=A0AAV9SLS8_9TELE